MKTDLLEQLEQYGSSDYYPLHMPGHKRHISHFGDPFAIDITEIDGFDNLHHAQGILLEAQKRAAQLYGAEESFYLVNGSTCGILAAVSAAARRGDTVLMARNCHKAVYHAVLLNGLHAEYLYPEADMARGINGSISPETVRLALEKHQRSEEQVRSQGESKNMRSGSSGCGQNAQRISAVIITSPTYDGVVSDIRQIAREVHRTGAVLIVDEAHGAHFPMHEYFPETALACGADLVINSLHKTMPALTQSALLHVQGSRVNRERLRQYLGIYQTSSPSYVLMAAMDRCVRLMQDEGDELFAVFTERLEKMRLELGKMKRLYLVTGKERELSAFDYDRSKVLISTERCAYSGRELAKILRKEYHLEVEMDAPEYVTAIMTVSDTQEGFDRLTRALLEVDRELAEKRINDGLSDGRADAESAEERSEERFTEETPKTISKTKRQGRRQIKAFGSLHKNKEVMTIETAANSEAHTARLWESAGCICAEFVYLYPPGIPLLVPGEQITQELLEEFSYYRKCGFELQGLADYAGEQIKVVRRFEAEQ